MSDCNQVIGRCQPGCNCAAYERYVESPQYEEDQRLETLALLEPSDAPEFPCAGPGCRTVLAAGSLCRLCQGLARDAAADAYAELGAAL